LKRYSVRIDAFPGTGGELAVHLINKFELPDINVEKSNQQSDHYDPEQKSIRLAENIYDSKSMTAIVVSAHEVGHAIQHASGYRPFFLRWHLAKFISHTEKIASMLLVVFPFATLLTRSPALGVLMFLVGASTLLLPVIFHLITLPVELDASFNRALPILVAGQYIPESGIPAAKQILRAAALTYVAASLASVFNFYRWIAILRR
jgi:Zn-dependent membrane protease YugP